MLGRKSRLSWILKWTRRANDNSRAQKDQRKRETLMRRLVRSTRQSAQLRSLWKSMPRSLPCQPKSTKKATLTEGVYQVPSACKKKWLTCTISWTHSKEIQKTRSSKIATLKLLSMNLLTRQKSCQLIHSNRGETCLDHMWTGITHSLRTICIHLMDHSQLWHSSSPSTASRPRQRSIHSQGILTTSRMPTLLSNQSSALESRQKSIARNDS